MSNPFEDLRQAVVVRPMNSPGPQGAAAPHMKIKYSADGVTWHNDPVETDKYLSFSTDNGITWSDAIYFNNLSETLEWVEKARQWAENPEDEPVEPGQYSALHHKEKAIDAQMRAETAEANALKSADNAATSESNAKTSEINAATSEANALESANNASTSANNALASENKAYKWAENPVDVEVEAGKYSSLHHRTYAERAQFEAEQARDNAAASMNAAAASAGSASQSASNALSSANDAELSKQKAYQWAENPVDIEVEAGLYSAKHWAKKAENIAVSPPHGDEAHTEDYVKEGDPRLSDARTPTEHGDEAHTEDYIKEGDSRLTNARMPLEHAQTHVDGTDDIQLATSTQKGLMSSAYAAKLDGIEANANNYIHPATHSLDMITETSTLKIMTADERYKLATMGGIPI